MLYYYVSLRLKNAMKNAMKNVMKRKVAVACDAKGCR